MAKDTNTPPAPEKGAVRELIPTGVFNEFGEVFEGGALSAQIGDQSADLMYVPGFSDLRWLRDKALSEVAENKRHPKTVPILPVNVRWSRRTLVSGKPDATKAIMAARKGYRAVTKADLEAKPEWLTGLPPGAQVLADGTIATADMTLMVCDGPTAARNAYEKQQATLLQCGAGAGKAADAGVAYQSERMAPLDGVPASSIKVR